MIASPVIGAAARDALFTIEPNTGFGREPADRVKGLAAAADAFGLGRISNPRRIVKPSQTSSIFEIESETAGPVMMRRSDSREAEALAAQCAVAARIASGLFVRPMAARDGGYVFRAGDAAWIAYPRMAGDAYDGGNCPPGRLFDAVFAFESAVAATMDSLEPAQRNALPRVARRTSDWPSFFDRLSGGEDGLDAALAELGPTTRELLGENGAFLQDAVQRAINCSARGEPVLVHNDLNHANVLVGADSVSFLDLEDIAFELPEVSLVHAVFKLLRHGVFAGHVRANAAGEAVPALIERLAAEGYAVGDRSDMFDYGALRILSEIRMICRYVLEDRDRSLVYDLEKKIHNLFELWIITEPTHEFATG